MVGSAIVRRLASEDAEVLTLARQELDLREQDAVRQFVARAKPDVIVLAEQCYNVQARVATGWLALRLPFTSGEGFVMDNRTLVGRLVRGLGSQSLVQLSTIAIRLVEVPVFLTFWPASRYGEWLIVSAATAYLTLSDFGMSQCVNRQIIISAATKDYEAAGRYLRAGCVFSAAASLLASAVLVTIVAAGVAMWRMFSDLAQGNEATVVLAATLLALTAVASLQMEYWLGVLASSGRYALGLSIAALVPVGSIAFVSATLFLGGGAAIVAVCMFGCQVLALVFLAATALRGAPWARIGKLSREQFLDVPKLLSLWRPALGILGFRLQQVINADFLRLVIGVVAAPVVVVVFATHSRLARFLTLATRMSYPLHVEMGAAFGANDIPLFRKIAETNVVLFSEVAILLGAAEVALGPFFFEKWVRGAIAFDGVLLLALVLGSALEILSNLALAPLLATNKYFDLAVKTTIIGVLMLPLAAAFGIVDGARGVAVAQTMAQGVSLAFCVGSYNRVLKTKFWHSVANVLTSPEFANARARFLGKVLGKA